MIPARIGSKDISQKVIRPFNGQPMIFSTINVALSIPDAHVIVNTDSKKIQTTVKKKYADSVSVYFNGKASEPFKSIPLKGLVKKGLG